MIIKKADYFSSGVNLDTIPEEGMPEFMFCGRSNVGKSSFINLLTNRKSLARTSTKPGKTQKLNFFIINDSFYFVDVPGYGFANVSKKMQKEFGDMIESYIKGRESLKAIFLLVDFRHKPSEDDVLMYNFLKYYGKDIIVIATKADKVKNKDRRDCKETIIKTLNLEEDGNRLIITSSLNKSGYTEVLKVLDSYMPELADTNLETNE